MRNSGDLGCITGIDTVAICYKGSSELSQYLLSLGKRSGSSIRERNLVFVAVEGPEEALVEFALTGLPGFYRGFIHREHLTLQN